MFDKCFGSEEISHKILLFRGRISITASVELLIQQINNTDVIVYIQVVEKWLANLKLRYKVTLRFKKYYNLKIINANKQCDTTNQQYWGFCLCSDHWKRIFEPEINKKKMNEFCIFCLPDKKLSTALMLSDRNVFGLVSMILPFKFANCYAELSLE